MSDKVNDDGPAFPWATQGMSLRDWFAGQALAGFIASKTHSIRFSPADDAEYVYTIADAMLKARGGGDE